jgi:RecA/RadA recombinase
MAGKKTAPIRALSPIRKAPTGIRGLDEISGGGLPKGRTTIICGGLGYNKCLARPMRCGPDADRRRYSKDLMVRS